MLIETILIYLGVELEVTYLDEDPDEHYQGKFDIETIITESGDDITALLEHHIEEIKMQIIEER